VIRRTLTTNDVVSSLTTHTAGVLLNTWSHQVYSLVFTIDSAAFTDSTTLPTSAVSILFDNARTALV
jgi:hypothetical protein